jgi:seryl-tRNA synthetase
MHDIKYIRQNPEEFSRKMERRGFSDISNKILELDKQRKSSVGELQKVQEESNKLAKMIGQLMAQGKKEEAQQYIAKSKEVKAQLQKLKDQQDKTNDINSEVNRNISDQENDELYNFLASIPNILDDEVPEGANEEDNIEIKKWSEPKDFNFEPKQHFDIGEDLGILDFEKTAKISGARFATLFGNLARLERALASFMIDHAVENYDYLEATPPTLVRPHSMFGTSQLPKFAEDSFKIENGEYFLIPTGEVPLTNLVRDQILEEKQLPLRYTCYSQCFRSEAGSAGKDTRGLIRMHQFGKVELVSITKPQDSKNEHERLLNCAEEILQKLDIAYRIVLLCSGDTGFGSNKTYDIEVFLPGQNKYREISSCSNFLDFQARRMNARYRKESDDKLEFVHTLNGSSLALGRTLVAILENYQNQDGSVDIPECLNGYMGGIKKLQNN